ncbi:hypothetical protein ACF0H5_021128 [Mactra antiquata]
MFCRIIAVLLIILNSNIEVFCSENVTENVHVVHIRAIESSVRRDCADKNVKLRKYKKCVQETIDELHVSLEQTESNLHQEIQQLKSSLDGTKNEMKTSFGRLQGEVTQFSDNITAIETDLMTTKNLISSLEQKLNKYITSIEACQSGVYYKKTLNTWTTITFPRPFSRVPQVIVGAIRLDVDKNRNTRYKIDVKNISTTGFQFQTVVWSDTILYAISFNWMACPK